MPTILDIHHAQVTVPTDQLQAAIDFYGGVLGLRRIERPSGQGWRPDGAWFAIGTRALHVGVEDGIDRLTRQHVAYHVDDLPAMLATLRQAGCACQTDEDDGVPVIPGWRRFQTRDPFGNMIEFVSEAAS